MTLQYWLSYMKLIKFSWSFRTSQGHRTRGVAKTKEMSSIWADRVHMRDGLDSITVHRLGCRDAGTIGLNDTIWNTKSNMGFLLHNKCEMLGKNSKIRFVYFQYLWLWSSNLDNMGLYVAFKIRLLGILRSQIGSGTQFLLEQKSDGPYHWTEPIFWSIQSPNF